MRFVWDEAKNVANRKKHGISFEEASALFRHQDRYLEIFDEAHSDDEERFIAIGPIPTGIVVVVFLEQDQDTTRIIGARRAMPHEAEMYHAYIGGKPR